MKAGSGACGESKGPKSPGIAVARCNKDKEDEEGKMMRGGGGANLGGFIGKTKLFSPYLEIKEQLKDLKQEN